MLSLYLALLSMRVIWNCCQNSLRKDFLISRLLKNTLHYSQHHSHVMLPRQRKTCRWNLEIQSDSTLKAKYLEVGIPGFFSYLPERFTNFRRFATRIMAMFGSTHVCEQLFSFMKSTKTCQRTTLTDEHLSSLIKVRTAQAFQPDISKIVMKRKHQASGQNV